MTKLLKMYGERNTNTNYMSNLIRDNLNVTELPGVVPPIIMKTQKLLPGNEMIRDIYFRLSYKRNLGWKHACVKRSEDLKEYEIESSVSVFLTITKNPYSWLLSLYRRPYHQYYRNPPSFEDFLKLTWKTVGRDNIRENVHNPVALWNIKNRSYLHLDSEKTINTTTEKIFESPEDIINEISRRYGIKKRSEKFIDYKSSTKDRTKDGSYYRNYYLSEKWRDNLSSEAISIINEAVDKELMTHFGYSLLR